MKSRNVGDEIVESMREALAIARGRLSLQECINLPCRCPSMCERFASRLG